MSVLNVRIWRQLSCSLGLSWLERPLAHGATTVHDRVFLSLIIILTTTAILQVVSAVVAVAGFSNAPFTMASTEGVTSCITST